MVKLYHNYCPEPLRPHIKVSNDRRFAFDTLESEYSVGTAGNADVGRGGTVHYFHGSEVAYWKNVESLQAGVLQSVGDVAGTEIILESTGNGKDALFYPMAMDAIEGVGEYEIVFIPWYWMHEYQAPVEPGFKMDEEELDLQELYKLTLPQFQWRRNKIISLKSDTIFRKEYPMNVKEAFLVNTESLFNGMEVEKARKRNIDVPDRIPVTMGVDPAGSDSKGADRRAISIRQGRKWFYCEALYGLDVMQLAYKVGELIKKYHVDICAVDFGMGYGIVARLRELRFTMVHGVSFGGSALDKLMYADRRCEMYWKMYEWLEVDNKDIGGVQLPDNEALARDLSVIPKPEEGSGGRKRLLKKKDIKKLFKIRS